MTSCIVHVCGGSCVFLSGDLIAYKQPNIAASISAKFCSRIETKYSWWVAHRGRNMLSTIALLFTYRRMGRIVMSNMSIGLLVW